MGVSCQMQWPDQFVDQSTISRPSRLSVWKKEEIFPLGKCVLISFPGGQCVRVPQPPGIGWARCWVSLLPCSWPPQVSLWCLIFKSWSSDLRSSEEQGSAMWYAERSLRIWLLFKPIFIHFYLFNSSASWLLSDFSTNANPCCWCVLSLFRRSWFCPVGREHFHSSICWLDTILGLVCLCWYLFGNLLNFTVAHLWKQM